MTPPPPGHWLTTLLPAPVPGLLAVLAGAFLAHLLGAFAGARRDAGVRVGYTRKVVHFGVFTAAALVYLGGALALTNAFGVGARRLPACYRYTAH